MNYNLNPNLFVRLILSPLLKGVNRLKVFDSIAEPFKNFLNDFAAFRAETDLKVQYSSSQLSLQTLLNKLFDSTLERIRIETTSDIISIEYGYLVDEVAPIATYYYLISETAPIEFDYLGSEIIAKAYSFEVRVPAALNTAETISKIAAWVNYYRLTSKTFTIKIF